MTAILSCRVQADIICFYMVGGDGNAPRGNFLTYYANGFTDRRQGHHPYIYCMTTVIYCQLNSIVTGFDLH